MANKKISDPSQFIKWLGEMLTLITNHGFWKIIEAVVIICFGISMFTIFLNPDKVFEAFTEWRDNRAAANREFRKVNDPLIRTDLQNVIYKTDAIRASVMEFHNGKENPSGLGFLYADMTYDIYREGYVSVVNQYQDVNLSWLNIPTILYENGYWYGTVEELIKIDPKLGTTMKSNGTAWVSFLLLSGSRELGILVLSFDHEPKDKQHIGRDIRKLGITIAAKLDYNNRF